MKQDSQQKAILLRTQGKSINEISRILNVSKGSVSRWCTKITLSSSQKEKLARKRKTAGYAALLPWIEKNKKRKLEDIKIQKILGKKDIGTIQARDLLMLGLGLYWGEGYKKGSQEWGLTNSDPRIIRTVMRWLHTCYNIEPSRIHARVTINKHYELASGAITRYWSKETGIPISHFGKPTFISGYGKPNRISETYRGTLRIKVRNGTSLRRRILASIEAISY